MHTKSGEVRWFPVHFPVGVMFSGFFRRVLHARAISASMSCRQSSSSGLKAPHTPVQIICTTSLWVRAWPSTGGSPAARTRPPGPPPVLRWGSAPPAGRPDSRRRRTAHGASGRCCTPCGQRRRPGIRAVLPASVLPAGCGFAGYGARPRSVGLPCAANPRRSPFCQCRAGPPPWQWCGASPV